MQGAPWPSREPVPNEKANSTPMFCDHNRSEFKILAAKLDRAWLEDLPGFVSLEFNQSIHFNRVSPRHCEAHSNAIWGPSFQLWEATGHSKDAKVFMTPFKFTIESEPALELVGLRAQNHLQDPFGSLSGLAAPPHPSWHQGRGPTWVHWPRMALHLTWP